MGCGVMQRDIKTKATVRSVRFSIEEIARIKQAMEDEDRGMSYIVRRAVRVYFKMPTKQGPPKR